MDIVPIDEIEHLVGARRQLLWHIGRANSSQKMFYILHSQFCLEDGKLLECDYSKALSRGIDLYEWSNYMDQPVVLSISVDCLIPAASLNKDLDFQLNIV